METMPTDQDEMNTSSVHPSSGTKMRRDQLTTETSDMDSPTQLVRGMAGGDHLRVKGRYSVGVHPRHKEKKTSPFSILRTSRDEELEEEYKKSLESGIKITRATFLKNLHVK
jgi:hypothetical protein